MNGRSRLTSPCFRSRRLPADPPSPPIRPFEFRNGKIIRFQQYTDTKQWAQVAQH